MFGVANEVHFRSNTQPHEPHHVLNFHKKQTCSISHSKPIVKWHDVDESSSPWEDETTLHNLLPIFVSWEKTF